MAAHWIKFCHTFASGLVFLVEVVPNSTQCDLLGPRVTVFMHKEAA